jgi:hypothetical protein
LLSLLLLATGCPSYEYEEEVFLEIDGSGRIRVSGSKELLSAYHDLAEPMSVDTVRSYFDAPGLDVVSVRETIRQGRTFLHVQGTFQDWNALCSHAAFAQRRCRLDRSADGLELSVEIPPPRSRARHTDGGFERLAAFRFHFPSTVAFHNSRTGLERGNIVRWERPVDELGEGKLSIQAHFGVRSILSATFAILVAAVAIVVLGVALTLALIVRKGRRQLAEERTSSA